MQVILLQRVEKLGKLGETVKVRPGYARNFLLPNKIALRATKANIAHFEKAREAGHLYGSVSAKDIADALKQEHVTKANVKINTPIKEIGIHPIQLQLH